MRLSRDCRFAGGSTCERFQNIDRYDADMLDKSNGLAHNHIIILSYWLYSGLGTHKGWAWHGQHMYRYNLDQLLVFWAYCRLDILKRCPCPRKKPTPWRQRCGTSAIKEYLRYFTPLVYTCKNISKGLPQLIFIPMSIHPHQNIICFPPI